MDYRSCIKLFYFQIYNKYYSYTFLNLINEFLDPENVYLDLEIINVDELELKIWSKMNFDGRPF